MCWSAEVQNLPLAARFRREIADYIKERVSERDAVRDAEVVIGELLGNGARHAPGPMCADVIWTDDLRPALVVHDAGPCFEAKPRLPGTLAESGRGLSIAQKLAERIDVRHIRPRGCMVTAVLRLTKRAEAPTDPHPCPRGPLRSEVGCACAMLVHGIPVRAA